jgi:hypothetical protein
MKRIVILGFLIVALSPKLKAQTKEETIKWMVQKMEQYGTITWYGGQTTYDQYIDDDGNKIIISQKQTFNNGSGDESYNTTYTINLNMLYSSLGYFNSQPYNWIFLNFTNNSVIFDMGDGSPKQRLTQVALRLNWDGEDSLRERFKKAIDNLIRFNKESSPKEIY